MLVVGGGPAAATAARLLALWGRDVVVAAKPAAAGEPELPESLTPSCGKFFDLMAIRPAIDALGFVRSSGHTVWWGADAPRVEPFDAGLLGWQATTGRLSEAMLACAAEAGARVVRTALTSEQVLAWPARLRLDATGRGGVLARTLGGRRYEPGHRTVALIGLWRREDGWPLPNPSHTLLESYEDGWAWSIPLDDQRRAIAVMVDPKVTALTRGEGATATLLAEVAKTRQLARLAAPATFSGGPWGWDASMYDAGRVAGDDWLLVGDAGSFVDPLSSAGVRKAMASAWQAAVTANTILHDKALVGPALDLFRAREAATYRQFRALTRAFMAEGSIAREEPQPFWAERGRPSAEAGDGSAHRADVQSAFERLKTADPLTLHRGPDVRIEVRPAIGERLVTMERHLVTDGQPEGVRFVLDVDVVTLVELADQASDVPGLHRLLEARIGPVAWPAFLTALATALARRWLLLVGLFVLQVTLP